jgi:hypothetical protein
MSIYPNCDGATKNERTMRPERSRWPAVTACALATPAWMCGLFYLALVLTMHSTWRGAWVAGALMAGAMALLVYALRRIDWLGRLQVLACLAVWIGLLNVITPAFGILGYLLIIPLAVLAALGLMLGAVAFMLHWHGGWPARLMALLACSGLPLFLGSLSLLGSAHRAHEAKLIAESKARPPKAIPPEQRRYFVRTEDKRTLSLPQNAYCVVAPAGGPVPTPEEAASLVEPIAAEDIRAGTFVLRLGHEPGYAYYERLVRVEHPAPGRSAGSAAIPESWPYQPIFVYPGESYLTPRRGRDHARPISVRDLKAGMYLQICKGRVPTRGTLLVEPIIIHYEKVTRVELGP